MSRIAVTDQLKDFSIEEKIIGEKIAHAPTHQTEILLVWNREITAEFIDSLPRLKLILRYGVGFDRVDTNYAQKKGISVCNVPDYCTEEVSDTAMAFILSIGRGIFRYDYLSRNYDQSWQENTLPGMKRISQQKLGIIGAGRIGGRVLLNALACNYQVGFFDPYRELGYEKVLGSERYLDLESLLKESDIVSLHLPLTPQSENLVDEKFLEKMRPGSSLVNTARGKIIKDIDIFYDALKDNHLSNVALDVLPHEPPRHSRLIKAWREREPWLDGRLIINPHVAFYSAESLLEIRRKVAENILRFTRGDNLRGVVNFF
jgi:C-terminal binding protein